MGADVRGDAGVDYRRLDAAAMQGRANRAGRDVFGEVGQQMQVGGGFSGVVQAKDKAVGMGRIAGPDGD